MNTRKIRRGGFSFIEVILASAIFLFLISGIALLTTHTLAIEQQSSNYLQAIALAEQGREGVRFLRKAGFEAIEPMAEGGIRINEQGELQLDTSPDVYGQFERRITIGTLDDETKQIDITVLWNTDSDNPTTFTLTDYLYNWERPF